MHKILMCFTAFFPNMSDSLHGGNFCPSNEQGVVGEYQYGNFFIMQFIALLDSGVRFTEGLEDGGMLRIIG